MTRSRYGLIAGIATAALGAWWWRRRDRVASGMTESSRQRGEVIYSNAPEATGLGGGPS